MRFGIGIPISHSGVYLPSPFASPSQMVDFARKAEALGFYSAWALDHIAPTKDRLGDMGEAPVWYEILASFSYLSGATSRIKFGAAVLVPIFREVVTLAKQLSTLDVLSGGRLLLGMGLGGHRDEFEAVRPKERGAHRGRMFLESLEALKLLLGEDNASFNGEYYEFHDVSLNPKPVQRPLPFYITGKTDDTPRRVARYASGYLLSRAEAKSIRERIERLTPVLEEHGRSIEDLDIAITQGFRMGRSLEEALEGFGKSMLPGKMDSMAARMRTGERASEDRLFHQNLIGTSNQIGEQVNRLAENGIKHCILLYPAVNEYQEMVEQTQWFAEEVIPKFDET